ncbi:MAG: hypothetical protein ACOCVF_00375 [bacterium]
MSRTGYKRSLTLTIVQKVDGINSGWSLTYDGKKQFEWDDTTYIAIIPDEMSTMPLDVYETRLEAFKAYVTDDLLYNHNIEIIFDDIINPDYLPYENDPVLCDPNLVDYDTCTTCGLELLPYPS